MTQIGDERELFIFAHGERGPTTRVKGAGSLSEEKLRIRQRSGVKSLKGTRDKISGELEVSLMLLGRFVCTAGRHGITIDMPVPMATVWNAIVQDSARKLNVCKRLI